jgi:hypothetical protein
MTLALALTTAGQALLGAPVPITSPQLTLVHLLANHIDFGRCPCRLLHDAGHAGLSPDATFAAVASLLRIGLLEFIQTHAPPCACAAAHDGDDAQ